MSRVTLDGRSTRWNDHRAARRAELVRAASRAVHRRGPEVSMDEIAAEAGTSKPILYRYFDDRTGLQIAVGAELVGRMRATLVQAAASSTSPRESLYAMVDAYLHAIEDSPNVYYFVTRTGAVAGTAGSGTAGSGTAGSGTRGSGADVVSTAGSGARVAGGQPAPLAAFVDSVTAVVAAPLARAGHLTLSEAVVWAAGAIGFVRGTAEWWLEHRGEPGVPDRVALAGRVTAWLWTGADRAPVRASDRAPEPASDPAPVREPDVAANPDLVPGRPVDRPSAPALIPAPEPERPPD